MKPRPACSLGLLLLFAMVVSTAKAGERSFEQFNFAITIPSAWIQPTNLPITQNVVLMSKTPDSKRMIIVRVDPDPPYKGFINEQFVAGMERSLQENGDKLISSNFTKITGVPAYERTGVRAVRNKQVATFLLGVFADGKSYSVQGINNGSGPAGDKEVRQILSSFRFLVTPKGGHVVNVAYMAFAGIVLLGIAILVIVCKRSNRRPTDASISRDLPN